MLDRPERELLYGGRLVTHAVQDQVFAGSLWAQLQAHFGESPRDYRGSDFLARLQLVRQELSQAHWRSLCRDFLQSLGIDLAKFSLDRFRLRGVMPGAENIPAAAAAFYAHRDCWYANPQAQINLWMPLHDVDRLCSFGFYPELFEVAVENESCGFDYDDFVGHGGFQSTAKVPVHPHWTATEQPEPPYCVELKQGNLLLFSAAHLHRSLPNRSGRIRFSLDLRLVHLQDYAQGLGAPNCDNRSRGSALADYTW